MCASVEDSEIVATLAALQLFNLIKKAVRWLSIKLAVLLIDMRVAF